MAILDSTIVKGDLTVTGTIRGLGGNSSGGSSEKPLISKFTQVASTPTLNKDHDPCDITFSLTTDENAKINVTSLIIFAMNGSFITTPLTIPPTSAPNTRIALCCGSFAYNSSGSTRIVRARITKSLNQVQITFDNDFRSAIRNSDMNMPYGVLLFAE